MKTSVKALYIGAIALGGIIGLGLAEISNWKSQIIYNKALVEVHNQHDETMVKLYELLDQVIGNLKENKLEEG